ncbi:cytochrome c oxidase assembly protein [Pseudomonas ovata]|uniref:cytochrome c oxidase assembly protein n=1 Tax=Pseudomonas ovata TaxID=1839709 RepID=UPI000D6886B4|nr:cytochrome c oxidase assembly protein [Pseudomonas ovata]
MRRPAAVNRVVIRLVMVVVAMFGFGFALVPLYEVMCQAFGINGKTGGQYRGEQVVDEAREVRVQFVTSNAAGMSWAFYPGSSELRVHPGAVNEMLFVAHNPTGQTMTAQAVPSVAPGTAAAWFHKTECFCFTQQVLQPGERIEMPVRFIVDRQLPAEIKQLTLAYTLFDITQRRPRAARVETLAAGNGPTEAP